ncbi:hypothetical protein MJI37_34715, partial [Salmonella enterica subsp. enterica serovar Cerro]|nr:hypothetical protein [Salmonella enterica subsp. enterica serovar Cerro]
SRQQMQACVDRGLYIGITGWVCDERRGLELRELLPFIPAEKLLKNADLRPQPLKFGLAGGSIVSNIHLEGDKKPMQGRADIQAR